MERFYMTREFNLIIGMGKFGKIAFDHFKTSEHGLIIVTDKDPSLANELGIPMQPDITSVMKKIEDFKNNNSKPLKKGPQSYFIEIDLTKNQTKLQKLVMKYIPEWIIPVAPIHIAAILLQRNIEAHNFNPDIPDFQFQEIISDIPQHLILRSDPFKGVIILSYAEENEICPEDCFGPESYCPNFGRPKEYTITEIVSKLSLKYKGFIFESHQIKEGLGGLKGIEFIKSIESLLEFLNNPDKPVFFIATTCNCHGVINLFFKKN